MSVFVAVLMAATAAQGARPTALSYSAPQGCPEQRSFIAALEFRTTKIAIANEGQQPTAWLDVVIAQTGPKLTGTLTVRLPSGATTRAVTGSRCESVVDALSLVAALLIDPENARTGALPPEVITFTLTPEPEPEPEPVPSVVSPVLRDAAPPSPLPSSTTVRLGVFAGPHLTTAISGSPDFGGTGGVSLEAGRLLARLSLGAGSGSTVQGDLGRARYPFHLHGAAEAGVQVSVSAFRFEGTLTISTLGFNVSSLDAVEPQTVWRWLLPFGASLRAGVRIDRLFLSLSVFGGVNLRRDTYLVTPDGDVFTTPLLFIHPALFVSWQV